MVGEVGSGRVEQAEGTLFLIGFSFFFFFFFNSFFPVGSFSHPPTSFFAFFKVFLFSG